MERHYIERDINVLFYRNLKSFPVVTLTGARQTGKTTLIKHLLKDYEFISLDNLNIRQSAVSDPQMFIERLAGKIIIDEIQYAPQILPFIKFRVDNDRNNRGAFVLTGSQQFLMMKGLSETLAGRIGIMNLYPLSAREAYRTDINTLKIFKNFATRGSFPEPFSEPDVDIELWYNNYLNIYIERDVKSLYEIGDAAVFSIFLKLLAARTGQILNMTGIAVEAGVSVPTVKRWISILQASNIIYLLKPYHTNAKKRLVKSPKLFFCDTALAARLCGIKTEKALMDSPFLGAIFENFCVMEALKTISNSGIAHEMYFIRTNKGLEVDLLIQTDSGLSQFEIKASKTIKGDTADGMIEAAKSILPAGKLKNSTLITYNDTKMPFKGGVEYGGLKSLIETIKTTG
jgi:predicted AAA+ superfamily ATPase